MTELELKCRELDLKERELSLKEKELNVNLKIAILDFLKNENWENAFEWVNESDEVLYPNYFSQLYEVLRE